MMALGRKKPSELTEDDIPEAPIHRKYRFDVGQIESVLKKVSQQPEGAGTIWAKDEFAGIFKGLGQYKSRGGDDTEVLLGLWDGSSIAVDRADEEKSFFIHNPRMSMAGGLQPGAAAKLFEDPDDDNGKRARFLIASPKSEIVYRRRRDSRQSERDRMFELLDMLFTGLEKFPKVNVDLSDEADDKIVDFHNALTDLREQEQRPAMQNHIAKLKAYVCRIALVLHCIECVFNSFKAVDIVEPHTVDQAILTCKYYYRQALLMQARSDESGESTSITFRIQEFAKLNPQGVTLREIYRKVSTLQRLAREERQPVGDLTKGYVMELVRIGAGRVEYDENDVLTYHAEGAAARTPRHVEAIAPPVSTESTLDNQTQNEDDIEIEADIIDPEITSEYGFECGQPVEFAFSQLSAESVGAFVDSHQTSEGDAIEDGTPAFVTGFVKVSDVPHVVCHLEIGNMPHVVIHPSYIGVLKSRYVQESAPETT